MNLDRGTSSGTNSRISSLAKSGAAVGHREALGVRTGFALAMLGLLGIAFAGFSPTTCLAGDAKKADAPAAGAAGAAEAVAAYTATETLVRAHLRDKANDALVKDVTDVAKTASTISDPKLQAKYLALIGTVCQSCSEDEVQKVCIKLIGETKDPTLFKYIRPFLAQPNVKETPPLLEEAMTATAKLVADDAVLPLMKLVEDSKVMAVAQAAIKAFAGYGASKRMRVQIVKDLANTVGKDQPGVGQRWDNSTGTSYATGHTKSGEESRNRWGALAPELTKTLNAMTGQNCPSAEEWFSLLDKYKASMGALFPAK